MAYFTKEQISKAKEIDLYTYLKEHDPDELVHESRNSYCTREHDSLKISNGLWHWFSRGIGGKTALEYLIKVKGYTFTDAVSHLLNQKGLEKKIVFKPQKKELTEEEKIKRFKLPVKALNNNRAISYLKGRGISKNIIEWCIENGSIYQDYCNNVVFLGCDNNNIPRYAGIRGTTSKRFMYEAYCSDKAYSFKINSIYKRNSVHLFESAIDLLSYATLKELNNELFNDENLLSLAGVYRPAKIISDSKTPEALSAYLKNNPNIDTIIMHLDNDETGRLAAKAIQFSLPDSYKIIDNPPKIGKDYNDYLCIILGKTNNKNYDYYR